MLCCDAAVVPIVLDGTGQPLDVGRATRTIPDGLRRAVAARDRGCAHPGCGRPASWCEVHHIEPWENGGETAVHNCVMLCKAHHRLIHHSGWNVATPRRPARVHPTRLDRPRTKTPAKTTPTPRRLGPVSRTRSMGLVIQAASAKAESGARTGRTRAGRQHRGRQPAEPAGRVTARGRLGAKSASEIRETGPQCHAGAHLSGVGPMR